MIKEIMGFIDIFDVAINISGMMMMMMMNDSSFKFKFVI
jgi:hypothetical protein